MSAPEWSTVRRRLRTGWRSMRGSRRRSLAAGVIVVLVLAGGGWWAYGRFDTTRITAYFDSSVGVYPGSEVRILGVPVGAVDTVTPQGDRVKVTMHVARRYAVPADAKAAQITPSAVSDRFIQLTPAYRGGPKMGRRATIPKERTATPVEVDRLYHSISELSDALGPNGANKEGALNDLLHTSADNLAHNGDALANSLNQLSHAAGYLNDSRDDIFGTVKNLQVFVRTLAENDSQVRQFETQLADLAGFLASERTELGQALNLLSTALGEVARFVDHNRDLVAANAEALTTLTKTLADQRDDVAKALPVLPLALSNLINVHNGEAGTLDMRADLTQLQDPFGTLCQLLDIGKLSPGDPRFEAWGKQLRPVLDQCANIAGQLTAGVRTPTLILPFGILSGENEQRNPVPGTVPGIPSDQLPPSQGGQQLGQPAPPAPVPALPGLPGLPAPAVPPAPQPGQSAPEAQP